MPYRKHTYIFLIFIFTLVSGAFAQETADYRVLQSQSNDTLYLKFELKRTSITPLLLGGYNLVFKIDPAVVDTNNFVLVDQGKFGSSTINYTALQLLKVKPGVFQVALSKKFPITGSGLILQDLVFQNAGIAAFKIKKCGASSLSFPTQPLSSVIDWALNDMLVTSIPPSPLLLTSKFLPKPVLKLSKSVVCTGSSINLVADSNVLFSNYTLFSRSKTGVVSAVGSAQAKSVFKNVPVTDTTTYFVTFDLGTCKDTTILTTVFTAPSLESITITASNNSPCLGDVVTYTAAPQVSGSKYVWKLIPIGTSAVFVGASTGLDLSSVQVDFKGTVPYSATLIVQDTNSFGCASSVVSRDVNPVSCTFNADFEVNGSNFAVSACQSADVSFKDASTVSGGLSIVKWEWDFGPGSVPDTFSTTFAAPDPRNIPPLVKYTTAGVVGVRLIVTNNLGAKDTIVKSPTINVLAGLAETPLPTCGSSSCNDVNFNWQLVQGATNYQVRYKKSKNGVFQPFQNVGIINTFKVNASSSGMGGTLDFNDTNNDTVYFQVRALASICDTTTSDIVFCKPSYCTTEPGCILPPISIIPPVASCKGNVVQIKVVTTPNDFTIAYPNVAFSWDNGKFDTSHVYNAFITDDVSQSVKLLVIDTTKVNCYSLNTVSVPVTPILTSKPDLGIQSLECDKVTFVWKHVEGAVGYEIQYSGTCIATQAWKPAPLGGLAEFFEIANLTDSCKLNFNVRAVGGCNTTQSDTLVAPPTCSCYIGHIPSSSTKSCALDTVRFSVTDFQIPNWLISWENPITGIASTPSKDSVFTFIPAKTDTIYRIRYTISNPTKASCNTVGYIYDTTGTPGNAAWAPRKDIFCIKDAIYALNEFDVNVLPNTSFLGNGIVKLNDSYYFDPTVAGLGTHIISHNACGSAESLPFKVVNTPCVSTVVDGGLLGQPEGIYTACDGTIFLSDYGNSSLFRYKPGDAFGIPELLLQSSPSAASENGNASNVRVGNTAGIVFDETTGDDVYFVDKAFNRIKRLEISKQKVTIVSGQNGLGNLPSSTVSTPVSLALGRFNGPWGLAIHPNADTLYVADEGNRLLKSLTIKGNMANRLVRWRAGLLSGGINPPSKAKNSNIRLHNIAVDSGYVNISDYAFNYNISSYNFATDSVKIVSKKTLGDYADGFSYMQRKPDGVSPTIGDWIYFTDSENFALRRVNRKNGYMETVAGNPPPNPLDGTSNGLPLTEAKFSDPGPIAFNIRGYIDILDRTGASGKSAVRRYYIPRWGETWTGFDTSYVAKCDRDTVRPVFGGGRLRVISGKDLTAVINDSIFAPKDTGQYLLGYYLKIGRCDTTFFQKVYVKTQPKLILNGDTVCADSFLLKAKTAKDTTVKYKWFGPTKATSISTSDTSRSIIVKQTGYYYLGIFYGKGKKCSIFDSAHVVVVPPGKGRINPVTPPLSAILSKDSARICFGDSIRLSMDELSVSQPKFVKFKWSKGDTIKTIFGSDSTTYSVEAIDTLGCIARDTFTVVEQKKPKTCLKVSSNGIRLPIIAKKAFVCKGNVFSLQDSCNALPKNDVKWQKRTAGILTTVSNVTSLSDTGTYILSVTSILNGNLCPTGVKDSVHVVYFVPNASGISVISPSSPFVPCKPDTFKVTGTSGFGKYVWYNRIGNVYTPIDTTTVNETTLKVNLNVSKVDSAYLGFIIQNPISGCFDTTSFSTELKVKLYPRIAPVFIDSLTCAGNTTLFKPASVDSTKFTYYWDFGVSPVATSSKAKTGFTYATYGTYQVKMIGWNKAVSSCKDTITRSIKITTRPRLDLTINGLSDTAKYCSTSTVQANLLAKVVIDVNAAGGPFTFKWQETYPKGGKLDSSYTFDNTIASPQTIVGELSSLFGYKVSVTDSKNCVSRPDSVYARVSTPSAFTVDALPLSPICKGQSVTLTPSETVPSTDKYSYKWDTSGVRLNFNTDTTVASLSNIPKSNVTYRVLIKNLKTLCTSTVSTPIQLRTIKINFAAIFPQKACSLPDTTRIVANVTDAITPYQWVKWMNDSTGKTPTSLFNYSTDLLSVDARRDSSRVYKIVLKDKDGCADSSKVSVPSSIVQPPVFLITKGKDTSVCVGGSVKVSLKVTKGTAPFTFTWTKSSEVNVTDPYNPIITPTASRKYEVTMRDVNNCGIAKDSVKVTVIPAPLFTVETLPLSPVCKGQSVTLTPKETVTSTDKYSYKWDTSGVRLNLDPDTTTAPLTNTPKSNVTYRVLIKNLKTLCTSTISTPIQLRTIKINFAAIAPQAPCSLPDTTRIVANVTDAISPYQWVKWTHDSTGKTPTSLFNYSADLLSVDARRDSSRVYKIVLKDKDGCTDSSKVRVPASSVQPPAFSITKGKDTIACVGAKVKVSLVVTKGTEPYKFVWSKQNEVDTTDRYNPIISPTASGTYVVTMTDANNCGQASEKITITQYDMNVLASNDAITGLCKSSTNPNPLAKLEANVTNTPSVSGATYTYTWTNIGTNTNLNTNSATVLNVANAGKYEVQVRNNLTGCVRRDTTSFKILNKPENLTLLTGIPSITCSARTISLSSSFVSPISSKVDSITYRWKIGGNPAFQTANKYDSAIVATLSATDVGNVTFKVYAENKCGIDSSSKVVSVSGTPKPNSDLKGGVFCDTIVPLVASILPDPTLNYKWSGPNNINTIISDDATRSITTKTPGKFWVLIYDKNNPGCNRLDSATIVINKAGAGAIQLVNGPANQNSIKVCFDVPVNLEMREATTTQAKFKKFVWNTLKAADTTRSIAAVGAKWFKVSATDSIGCVVTDSFKVEEQPRPIACIEVLNAASKVIPAVNKQVNVCSGDGYTISDTCNKTTNSVLDPITVKWRRKDVNGVLSALNGTTQYGSYTYIETITPKLDGVPCPNSAVDSVVVIERPNPSISIIDTAADPFICNNEVFGLSAQPATFVKYFWYKTPSTSTTGVREPFDTTTSNSTSPAIVSLSPNDNFTQIYEVEGVDQYGCVATSSSAVTKAVFPIPALDFGVEINCLGIATKFTPDVVDVAKYEYRWDFGDTTTLLDVSPIPIESYIYDKAGTYKVRLSGQSILSTKLCNNYEEKLVTIKDPAKLDLTVNGVADTLKICGTANGVNLNAVINSSSQTWAYDWTEIVPLGGKLDSTNTTKGNNTAKPIVKSGETTSLYGYSVQATDTKNCVSGRDTTFVRVSVAPEFDLTLNSNGTVCKGDTISISAINQKPSSTLARYKYVWDTSGVDLKVNNANLVSKPKKSVDYRFTVSDSVTSCSIQKSVKVTVQGPLVSIDPIANPAPCAPPDSIGIVANILQGLPLQSIQWIDSAKNVVPTTLYNSKLLTVSAFRDSTRTYGLIIKDNIGCVDTTFVRVNASNADAPKFAVVNGSSKGSCINTDVKVELRVITGRPQYSFVWTTDKNGTPATEVNTTDIFNPIISTSNISSYPKKYYVTFKDANNCFPALDSVVINQPADMQVSINGNAANICKTLANPNPTTSLEAIPTDIPSSSGSTYNYVWRNIETDQIVSSGSSFLNNVSSSGDYEVKVTNLNTSCERKDTALVSIINAPENLVITLADPTITCNTKPIRITATFNSPAKAKTDDITFEWKVIGGSNTISSFDSSVVYLPNPSDIGDVRFSVNAKNSCGSTIAITAVPIRLVAAAKAKLDVDAKEVAVNKNVVFINNSINTDSLVVLKITDGKNHDFGKIPGGTFNHAFSNKGTYKAKLYVINQNGCDAEDSVTITVIDKLNLFVPNVFSPSANDENNRFLRVYGVNISPQSFSLMVYNRWGQLVYSTTDLYTAMNVGWDGNDSSGESQMGVYTYILIGKFNTGGSINQTGTVTLLR